MFLIFFSFFFLNSACILFVSSQYSFLKLLQTDFFMQGIFVPTPRISFLPINLCFYFYNTLLESTSSCDILLKIWIQPYLKRKCAKMVLLYLSFCSWGHFNVQKDTYVTESVRLENTFKNNKCNHVVSTYDLIVCL